MSEQPDEKHSETLQFADQKCEEIRKADQEVEAVKSQGAKTILKLLGDLMQREQKIVAALKATWGKDGRPPGLNAYIKEKMSGSSSTISNLVRTARLYRMANLEVDEETTSAYRDLLPYVKEKHSEFLSNVVNHARELAGQDQRITRAHVKKALEKFPPPKSVRKKKGNSEESPPPPSPDPEAAGSVQPEKMTQPPAKTQVVEEVPREVVPALDNPADGGGDGLAPADEKSGSDHDANEIVDNLVSQFERLLQHDAAAAGSLLEKLQNLYDQPATPKEPSLPKRRSLTVAA